jgi:hypothetical protein
MIGLLVPTAWVAEDWPTLRGVETPCEVSAPRVQGNGKVKFRNFSWCLEGISVIRRLPPKSWVVVGRGCVLYFRVGGTRREGEQAPDISNPRARNVFVVAPPLLRRHGFPLSLHVAFSDAGIGVNMPRRKVFLLIVQVASLLFISLALLSFYGNASISIPYLRPPDSSDVPLGGRSMPRLHSSVKVSMC